MGRRIYGVPLGIDPRGLGLLPTLFFCLVLPESLPAEGASPRETSRPQQSTQRDVTVLPVLPAGKSLYANSWAVVVGINEFQNPKVSRLNYAANDATSVAQALQTLGFPPANIIKLLNRQATRSEIERVLSSVLRRRAGPQDRIFIFFATHGVTLPLPGGGEEGYLLPYDADPDDLPLTAFSMSQIKLIGQRLPAKHTLVAVDACYGGYSLVRAQAPPVLDQRYLDLISKSRAVQVITAGKKDQPVIEDRGHGVFTRKLLDGLAGHADTNNDGLITLSELGAWLHPRVAQASDYKQDMQWGNLDGEGQFVFLLPQEQRDRVTEGHREKVIKGEREKATEGEGQTVIPPPVASIPPPVSSLIGDLDLTSDPPGATVRLDGREMGKTPLTLERLPVGEHTLELDKDGIYAARRQITIAANTLEKLSLTLDRLKGKLTIFSEPRDATVLLDGKALGRTPLSVEAEAGPHILRITKEGYKPQEEALSVSASQETRTRIALRSAWGTLEVVSSPPGATVEIRGTARGQTPVTLALDEGTYDVHVVLPTRRTETRRAQITAEQTTYLHVDLSEVVLSPEEIYKNSLGEYTKGKYDLAVAGFKDFIGGYPTSSLVPNAHYWLGESYYSQKDYAQAIQAFEVVIRRFPESPKVPSALFKEGDAYLQMGDTTRATAVLCELMTKHPTTHEARLARERNIRCR